MTARLWIPLALAITLAGCVAESGARGFPGTEANPATGAFQLDLDSGVLMPKLSWVTVGTAVTFKDRMGEAHAIQQENRGNATIDVPAHGTTVLTWDSPGDIRLVCRMHGPDGMRGWLHIV